jgi:HSP20 family protein
MELVQYEPFSLMRDLDRFFDLGRRQRSGSGWLPRIDVFDRKDDLVVRAEIPGVSLEDIDVTIEDRTLTISGTRALEDFTEENGFHRREILAGEFKRTIVLPEGMNAEEITANASNGMLEVVVPRRPEVLPRKVKVDVTG